MRCISENSIFMQFHVILPDKLIFIQPVFSVIGGFIGNHW